MTLLIFTYAVSLCTVYAGAQTQSGYPDIPGGIPGNAVQYNKTDVTPVGDMTQVKAGEPALFRYRNMTMLMNCTQNCTLVVTLDPNVTQKMFRFDIEPNQTMTLMMNISGSPLQGEQVMERTLNFYLGLEPNAELQLNVQLRLHINQTQLSQELNREVNASQLTWTYWNGTQAKWIPVESYMDQNGYLVCNATHLSTWTIGDIEVIPEFPTLVILPLTILTTLLAVIAYGKKHTI